MVEYKKAEVKFNNGRGALLCNGCSTIIAEGFDHEDREHFCDDCTERAYRGEGVGDGGL